MQGRLFQLEDTQARKDSTSASERDLASTPVRYLTSTPVRDAAEQLEDEVEGNGSSAESAPETRTGQISPGRDKKGRGGNEHLRKGVRDFARRRGLDPKEVRQDLKIANLSEEAKDAARNVGLDDNKSAFLKATKEQEPTKQVEVLQEIAERKQETQRRESVQAGCRTCFAGSRPPATSREAS